MELKLIMFSKLLKGGAVGKSNDVVFLTVDATVCEAL